MVIAQIKSKTKLAEVLALNTARVSEIMNGKSEPLAENRKGDKSQTEYRHYCVVGSVKKMISRT